MGTQRTSNKDVLNAIERLTSVIEQSMTQSPAPVAEATDPVNEPTGEETIKVDGAYLSHMTSKVQDFANAKGEDAILYARRNGRGETKLAYCLASKWTGLRDRGLIGAVKHLSPAS